MYYAGIDIGSLTAEAVIVKDGKVVAARIMNVFPNPVDSAREVMGRALKSAGIGAGDISSAISTGYGRDQVQAAGMAQENVSEISCHGYGAFCVDPSVRTVIDIGGQDAKVIKMDGSGKLMNFVMNDKCAAGTGHFLEVMSRTLGVGLEELGPLALESKKPVLMSNRCTIYVETEVIHYLQRGVSRKDVAAGISRAMAERVVALARRVRPEPKVMLTGGVAKNTAVRAELEKILGARMERPSLDPQLIGAYGAAMLAAKGAAS
ncbi:MAG TPA: acyl-CoA dehydratase activase [bacterium]|nr:acyl-CoA dehydratase activase [bacterium]